MIKAKTPLPRLSGFPGGLTNRKRMGKRWDIWYCLRFIEIYWLSAKIIMERWSNEPRQIGFIGISTNGNGAATAGIFFGSLSSSLGWKQSLVAMVSQWTNQGHWWRLSKMALMKLAKLTLDLIVLLWWDCLTPTYVGEIDPDKLQRWFLGGFTWFYILVGGIPTPLKNMSSSVGMMTFPIYGKVIKFHGSKPPTSILTLINAMNLG